MGAAIAGSANNLYAWGRNVRGQLGLGDTTARSSPVQIGSLTNWKDVACGSGFTIAVKTDNTLWAWGKGADGRLALGNTTNYSSPKQIGSLTNWNKIASGYGHTLATTQ
jgi:alpha-tubulin suppressor-like RCC1 family protein